MSKARLILGDALEAMRDLTKHSIEAIICDPPHGCTRQEWDEIIPIDEMWEEIRRVLKPTGTAVLIATQPFTSLLVCGAPDLLKYEWIWSKNRPTGGQHAKRMPLRAHENILVFSKGKIPSNRPPLMTYNPQGLVRLERPGRSHNIQRSKIYGGRSNAPLYTPATRCHTGYPQSIIEFNVVPRPLMPTQKPLDLMRYLVRTFTNPDDHVLDFAMGSGTTGVAALSEGRRFTGIERSLENFNLSRGRLFDWSYDRLGNGG